MVQGEIDSLVGTTRDAVLISREDGESLSLRNGDAVVLRNDKAEFRGRALMAPMSPGNLQIHGPEAEVLISPGRRSPQPKRGKHVFI